MSMRQAPRMVGGGLASPGSLARTSSSNRGLPKSSKLILGVMGVIIVMFSAHHIFFVEEFQRATHKGWVSGDGGPVHAGGPPVPATKAGGGGRRWGYRRTPIPPHPPPPPPAPWSGGTAPTVPMRKAVDMMVLRRNGVYVLHTLLPRIKREIDTDRGLRKGMEGWGDPWDTCAVVGNSGNLRSQGMGEQIDRHEMVLRLNNAPTESFEADVGTRTDISFINGWKMQACGEKPGCPCFPYGDKGIAMVTILFRPEQIVDVKRCRRAHVKTRIFVVDSMMHDLAHRTVKEYEKKRFAARPDLAVLVARSRRNVPLSHSTGLQAVLMTLGLCRKISLFGFGTNTTQHHFYEAETPNEYADHDYEAEMLFYRELAAGTSPLGEWFPVPKLRFGDPEGDSWWGGGEEAVQLDLEVAQYRRR